MKRYAILCAAVAMQVCLGATYAWAVFVGPLKEAYGLGQGVVQLPFSIFYVVFPAVAALTGGFIDRIGPRRCAMAGGLLFGGGWTVASFGGGHFGIVALGIGAMAGTGAGLAYLVPISIGVQWFPRHKGLVTGIAVAGFGGGAALVEQAAGWMFERHGASPFEALRALGLTFAVAIPSCGALMAAPARPSRETPGRSLPLDVLQHPAFWLLYFAMFSGLAAGFIVVANLKQLAPRIDLGLGAAAVGVFALGNAAGRIVWGAAFDRMKTQTAIAANLLAQAAVLIAAAWALGAPGGLAPVAAAAGFNFGGVLTLYAASVARRWGAARMSAIYGWLFSANIAASFAPMAAGLAFDRLGGFHAPLIGAACLMALASALALRSGLGEPARR